MIMVNKRRYYLPHKVVDDEADKEVLVNANARL